MALPFLILIRSTALDYGVLRAVLAFGAAPIAAALSFRYFEFPILTTKASSARATNGVRRRAQATPLTSRFKDTRIQLPRRSQRGLRHRTAARAWKLGVRAVAQIRDMQNR